MRTVITPRKPTLYSNFYCSIKLKKSQVNLGGLRPTAERHGFSEQTNRHITIISSVSGEMKNALEKFSAKEQAKLIRRVKTLLRRLDWRYEEKDEIYLISKKSVYKGGSSVESRLSYIRLIRMPAMRIFYKKLNSLRHSRIPMQFPHITLFTKGERPNPVYYGISVSSSAEFRKLHPKHIIDEH